MFRLRSFVNIDMGPLTGVPNVDCKFKEMVM